jgi:acetyl-CoA carboxylase beta subunit
MDTISTCPHCGEINHITASPGAIVTCPYCKQVYVMNGSERRRFTKDQEKEE